MWGGGVVVGGGVGVGGVGVGGGDGIGGGAGDAAEMQPTKLPRGKGVAAPALDPSLSSAFVPLKLHCDISNTAVGVAPAFL